MSKLFALLFIVLALSMVVPSKATNNTTSTSNATANTTTAAAAESTEAGEGEGALNLVPALALITLILACVF